MRRNNNKGKKTKDNPEKTPNNSMSNKSEENPSSFERTMDKSTEEIPQTTANNNSMGKNTEENEKKIMDEVLEFDEAKQQKDQKQQDRICIAIDFGTTNSCAAVFDGRKCIAIPSPEGPVIFPTVVAYQADGQPIFGKKAMKAKSNVIPGVKRFLGAEFKSEYFEKESMYYPDLEFSKDPQNDSVLIKLTFPNTENPDGPLKEVYKKPQEIVSDVLHYIKNYAEDFINRLIKSQAGKKNQGSSSSGKWSWTTIEDCVLTVPVKFTMVHIRMMIKAAEMAGFKKVHRILLEPIAASLCYTNGEPCEKAIGIYDLGGGTFDFSIVAIKGNRYQVIDSKGDHHLGGVDFTRKLFDEIIATFKKQYGYSNTKIVEAAAASSTIIQDFESQLTETKRNELIDACETAKLNLSQGLNYTIAIRMFDGVEGHDIFHRVSRTAFETMNRTSIATTKNLIDAAVADAVAAGVDLEMTEIVLVGGSTRMPVVKRMLQQFFRDMPINNSLNAETSVAIGAAKLATLLVGGPNTKLMGSFGTTPVISALLNNSIGVELEYGNVHQVIKRGVLLPFSATYQYTPDRSGVDIVPIKVYEGERIHAKKCQLIGDCKIKMEKGARPWETFIEVELHLDANGNLDLKATEKRLIDNTKKMFMGFSASKPEYLKITQKADVVRDIRDPTNEEQQEDELLAARLYKIDVYRHQLSSSLSVITKKKELFASRKVPYLTLAAYENKANGLKERLRKEWDNFDVSMESIAKEMETMKRSWDDLKRMAGWKDAKTQFDIVIMSETGIQTDPNDVCPPTGEIGSKTKDIMQSSKSSAKIASSFGIKQHSNDPTERMEEPLAKGLTEEEVADRMDMIQLYIPQLKSCLTKAEKIDPTWVVPPHMVSSFVDSAKKAMQYLMENWNNKDVSIDMLDERVAVITRSWDFIEKNFSENKSVSANAQADELAPGTSSVDQIRSRHPSLSSMSLSSMSTSIVMPNFGLEDDEDDDFVMENYDSMGLEKNNEENES